MTAVLCRSTVDGEIVTKGLYTQLPKTALATVGAGTLTAADVYKRQPEYADASPQEIAKAAKQYMTDLHNALNPVDPKKDKDGQPKKGEIDYMAYLGLDGDS